MMFGVWPFIFDEKFQNKIGENPIFWRESNFWREKTFMMKASSFSLVILIIFHDSEYIRCFTPLYLFKGTWGDSMNHMRAHARARTALRFAFGFGIRDSGFGLFVQKSFDLFVVLRSTYVEQRRVRSVERRSTNGGVIDERQSDRRTGFDQHSSNAPKVRRTEIDERRSWAFILHVRFFDRSPSCVFIYYNGSLNSRFFFLITV